MAHGNKAIFAALLIAAAVATASGETVCTWSDCASSEDSVVINLNFQAEGDYSDVSCSACPENEWNEATACFDVPTLPEGFGDFDTFLKSNGYYSSCSEVGKQVEDAMQFVDDVAKALGASGEKVCVWDTCSSSTEESVKMDLSFHEEEEGGYSDVTCTPCPDDEATACFDVPTLPDGFGDFDAFLKSNGYYSSCDEVGDAKKALDDFGAAIATAAGIGMGVLIAIIVIPIIIIIIVVSLIVWCCCCKNRNTTVVVQQQSPQGA